MRKTNLERMLRGRPDGIFVNGEAEGASASCSRPITTTRWCGHLSHPQGNGRESDNGKVVSGCFFEAGCDAAELLEL